MVSMLRIPIVCIVAMLLPLVMQIPIARACRKNAAIAAWRPVLIAAAIMWGLIYGLHLSLIEDSVMVRKDGYSHNRTAWEIASFIRAGDFESVKQTFGISNQGFDFCIGVIYSLIGPQQEVVIGLFYFLAFCGLLTLLDMVSRSTGARQIPFWVVCMVMFYPEALFWGSELYKEALVLWAVCTMLRFVVPDPTKRGVRRWIAPTFATMVFAFVRPHIAFFWLLAIAVAQIVKRRKFVLGLFAGGGAAASFLLMMVLVPGVMRAAMDRGVISTLEEGVREQSRDAGEGTGSTIRYGESRPIPVVTGLTLLFIRPYPWEAPHIIAFLAGAEFWLLSTIMVFSWLNLRNRRKYIFQPLMLTAVFATLFLAFFFSYMYNLGLMVRQRMQFYPAMITLAATPSLIRRSDQYRLQGRTSHYGMPLMRPMAGRMPLARPMALPPQLARHAVPLTAGHVPRAPRPQFRSNGHAT